MKIGIRNPAMIGAGLTRWGDYHFGQSLATALQRRDVEVEQRYWPEWDKLGSVDVCLTLRGRRCHSPHPGSFNAIWIISHPSEVSPQEISRYDLVFSASERIVETFAPYSPRPIHFLEQCSDSHLFKFDGSIDLENRQRSGILFVANTRGIRRPALTALMNANIPVSIVGPNWNAFGLGNLVRRNYIDNHDLPSLYRSCKLALNDHWCDMKYFGIINNRIFDCLSTGTPVISDKLAAMQEIFGDDMLYWDDNNSLQGAMETINSEYSSLLGRVRGRWNSIGDRYSFERRAEQILSAVVECPPATRPLFGQTFYNDYDLSSEIEFLKNHINQSVIQLLHIAPEKSRQYFLSSRNDVSYFSAGWGEGPWMIDVSQGIDLIQKHKFNCIVIEENYGFNMEDIKSLLTANGRIIEI